VYIYKHTAPCQSPKSEKKKIPGKMPQISRKRRMKLVIGKRFLKVQLFADFILLKKVFCFAAEIAIKDKND
jgi:hypothetical protein